jgi:hypothetical protein
VPWPPAPSDQSRVARIVDPPPGCAGVIIAASGAFFVAGLGALAAWRITGEAAWIEQFFRLPGAMLMIWLAALELFLAVHCVRHFARGELMRSAWTLIALSAACATVSAVLVQVLGVRSSINPLVRLAGGDPRTALRAAHAAGQLVGGPFRFALLTAGLALALSAYRRTHFLGRLRWPDWLALAFFAAFLARNVVDIVQAGRRGKQFGWLEIANWPTDPLLLALLAEGLLLWRSVQQMGHGWIGRAWAAFSVAVFLTTLGDVGQWAEAYGYLPYPWSAAIWFVWLPAALFFALAPAYQLEAIRAASEGRR